MEAGALPPCSRQAFSHHPQQGCYSERRSNTALLRSSLCSRARAPAGLPAPPCVGKEGPCPERAGAGAESSRRKPSAREVSDQAGIQVQPWYLQVPSLGHPPPRALGYYGRAGSDWLPHAPLAVVSAEGKTGPEGKNEHGPEGPGLMRPSCCSRVLEASFPDMFTCSALSLGPQPGGWSDPDPAHPLGVPPDLFPNMKSKHVLPRKQQVFGAPSNHFPPVWRCLLCML